MIIKHVLNIEDDVYKYIAIKRALEFNGITDLSRAKNAEDGMDMLVEAIKLGRPYDLLVLDMQFPVDGKYHEEAGLYVMEQLKRKNIEIPIIICSGLNLRIPEAVDCLFYNESRDLNMDMKQALKSLTVME